MLLFSLQSLYFLSLKFQASSQLLSLYSPICVRPGWRPQRDRAHVSPSDMSLVVRKPFFFFAYAKTKTQISFTETTKLISAFVFATQIEQSLFYLNTKFQASSYHLWLYSPVCVGPGWKTRRPVSHNEAHMSPFCEKT